jgi:hypothetical protein
MLKIILKMFWLTFKWSSSAINYFVISVCDFKFSSQYFKTEVSIMGSLKQRLIVKVDPIILQYTKLNLELHPNWILEKKMKSNNKISVE